MSYGMYQRVQPLLYLPNSRYRLWVYIGEYISAWGFALPFRQSGQCESLYTVIIGIV